MQDIPNLEELFSAEGLNNLRNASTLKALRSAARKPVKNKSHPVETSAEKQRKLEEVKARKRRKMEAKSRKRNRKAKGKDTRPKGKK